MSANSQVKFQYTCQVKGLANILEMGGGGKHLLDIMSLQKKNAIMQRFCLIHEVPRRVYNSSDSY